MPDIEIYTTPLCTYCVRAKFLLQRKGIVFQEINVMGRPEERDAMVSRANGRTTVPQIFIDGVGIGGCEELMALERSRELDSLLGLN